VWPDVDEYVDFQYKAFNTNGANLIDEIQANTIMLFAGKFIFNESQLFVSVYLDYHYFSWS
jgi:hypothetical protein